jgi:hypothetical protein
MTREEFVMRLLAIAVPVLALAFSATAPAVAGKAVIKSTNTPVGNGGASATPGLPACDAGSKDPAVTNKAPTGGGANTAQNTGGQGTASTVKRPPAQGCPSGRRMYQP